MPHVFIKPQQPILNMKNSENMISDRADDFLFNNFLWFQTN